MHFRSGVGQCEQKIHHGKAILNCEEKIVGESADTCAAICWWQCEKGKR